MDEEILRIQRMVAEGKVTPEESIELLDSAGYTGDGVVPVPEPPADTKQGGIAQGELRFGGVKWLGALGVVGGVAIAVGTPVASRPHQTDRKPRVRGCPFVLRPWSAIRVGGDTLLDAARVSG